MWVLQSETSKIFVAARYRSHEALLLVPQKGFATFLLSVSPVTGSLNSLQLIGYIAFPASLVAIITPNSFFAVLR